MFSGVYFPPEMSPFYSNLEIEGFQELETMISESGDCEVLLCGDFNARTGDLLEFTHYDDTELQDEFIDVLNNTDVPVRKNVDKSVNRFGRSLIKFCSEHSLFIGNGRCGTNSGDYTYISAVGCSAIDYFILSKPLLLFYLLF